MAVRSRVPGVVVILLVLGALAAWIGGGPAEGAEKVLVYQLEGRPASLDPVRADSEREHHVLWHLCEALINVSRDGKSLEPGLAESWQLTTDGRQATMKLRRGVVFHDGTPVDAHAVKASFDRHHEAAGGDKKPVKAQMLAELVAAVEVPDPLTVVFKLKYPGLHYLSQIEVVSPSSASRLGQDFSRRPDCSGPFKFESWSDDRIVLLAHDRYWRGRPKIDRLTFIFISEGRAVAEGLLKHEVDFSPNLPDPVVFERLRESQQIRLVPVPGLNVFYLGFYTERPPFNNVAVRRAFAHAINVPRTALFLGRGAVTAAQGPLSPAMKGYDAAVSQAAYDPDAARQLLQKAGHGSGLTIGLVHNAGVPFQAELAGALQSDLRRIGVTVDLLGKPNWRDVISAARAREGHAFLYGWLVRAPYPERLLTPLFHSRSIGTSNLTNYANPALDKLLDEAYQVSEEPGQARAYARAQSILVEDAPMVFLYHLTRMAAYTDRLRGLELNLGALPHDKLVTVDLAR